jgi:hypothetical protein
MTTERPMDPERLALFRERYSEKGWLIPNAEARDFVMELLAHADYHEERADRATAVVRMMAESAQAVARAAGWPDDMPVEEPAALVESVAGLRQQAEIGRQWHEDSSLERWFPLTAERLREVEAERDRLRKEADAIDGALTRMFGSEDWRPHGPASVIAEIDNMVEKANAEIDRLRSAVVRLRARVQVTAEDVERVGATHEHALNYVSTRSIRVLSARGFKADLRGWLLHDIVNAIASHLGRPGLDILDEMAAMEVPK